MFTPLRINKVESPIKFVPHKSWTLGSYFPSLYAKSFWWTALIMVVIVTVIQALVGYYSNLAGSVWYHVIIYTKYGMAITVLLPGLLAWIVGSCGLTRREFAIATHIAIIRASFLTVLSLSVIISMEYFGYRILGLEMSTTSTYAPTIVNNYGDLLANIWIFFITFPMVACLAWLVGVIFVRWAWGGIVAAAIAGAIVTTTDGMLLHGNIDVAFFREADWVPFPVTVTLCVVLAIGSAWLAQRLLHNANISTKSA